MKKKLTVILVKLHFTALQYSVFGEVRELVGENKHTFDPTSNTPVPYQYTVCIPVLIQKTLIEMSIAYAVPS